MRRSMKSPGRRPQERKAKSASKMPPTLTPSDIANIVGKTFKQSRRDVIRCNRATLLQDIKGAIESYKFRARQARKLAPFRLRLDNLYTHLKGVQANLPIKLRRTGWPDNPRKDELFEYVASLGETYAAAHPHFTVNEKGEFLQHLGHPGIQPTQLPVVCLPDTEDGYDFNSARRLRELMEAVDQVLKWMDGYDEAAIPEGGGWAWLAEAYGPTRAPLVALAGKILPTIFEKHFGKIEGNAPWIKFVRTVCETAHISSRTGDLTPDAIKKYRKRLAAIREPFEMVDPKADPDGEKWEEGDNPN
jgi:hypothetical protein